MAPTLQQLHPLDNLSADEIRHAAALIRRERGADTGFIFSCITLKEPSKDAMMIRFGWERGSCPSIDREAFAVLVDKPSGVVHEIVVNLTQSKLTRWNKVEGQQPTIHIQEALEAAQIIVKDPRVIEQCRLLGIHDMSQVRCDPWGVGYHSIKGKRLAQAILYLRPESPYDNQYAHPLDFSPLYDMCEKRVIDMMISKRRSSKYERPTIPRATHPYLPEAIGPDNLRKDIKPIEISQPEGVSFTVRGQELDWQKWNMRIGFNYREGLVISNVSYLDNYPKTVTPRRRPILYRMSLSEMVVPYGNPYEPYNHKMAFDAGEYGLGTMTNSLRLGCDCVGSIHYMDAMLTDLHGEPWHIPNAICIHEEDAGLLFKHTDMHTDEVHSARSRRLVISHIVTAANYDYGIYYYFYQDGTIQFEVKATGVLNTQVLAKDEEAAPYGTMVAPQVDAQHHQHLFCMRIDPMVDGRNNSVAEDNVITSPLPVGHKDNEVGNAFYPVTQVFNTTSEAQRGACSDTYRTWRIINEAKLHPWARQPVGFKLTSPNTGPLLPKPGSIVHERATFASKTLWVTPYDADQQFPGGLHCYRSDPALHLGMPQWVKEPKDVRNKDVVCWFTFGITHVPRVEDFPVMPVETCGLTLKPTNFFLGSPAMDVPSSTRASTKSTHAGSAGCCDATPKSRL